MTRERLIALALTILFAFILKYSVLDKIQNFNEWTAVVIAGKGSGQ